MEIKYDRGICLTRGDNKVLLDPTHQTEIGVVSHGHMDHLVKDAHMTHKTLDILGIRTGERRGKGIHYGFPYEIGGFEVTLHPAGHVFGSAMVMVEEVLYTGDFNPAGGLTSGIAKPMNCETLIMETTYGKEEYRLPPKDGVLDDIRAWTEHGLEEGPLVFGGYEFGKAQEMIALLNEMGQVPYVPEKIAGINEIYNSHGVGLEYEVGVPEEDEEHYSAVVTPGEIKKPAEGLADRVMDDDGMGAYLSGWCAFYPYFRSMDIDAQFPLSDHAGFDELLDYVERCDPERVLTLHGSAEEFSEAVEEELGIESMPLKSL